MKKVPQTKIKAKYFMHLYWNLITICFARKYMWTGHLVLVYTVQLCAIIICYNYTNITPYGDTLIPE